MLFPGIMWAKTGQIPVCLQFIVPLVISWNPSLSSCSKKRAGYVFVNLWQFPSWRRYNAAICSGTSSYTADSVCKCSAHVARPWRNYTSLNNFDLGRPSRDLSTCMCITWQGRPSRDLNTFMCITWQGRPSRGLSTFLCITWQGRPSRGLSTFMCITWQGRPSRGLSTSKFHSWKFKFMNEFTISQCHHVRKYTSSSTEQCTIATYTIPSYIFGHHCSKE